MSKLRTLMKLAPFAVAALTMVKGSHMRDRYGRRDAAYAPSASTEGTGYQGRSSTAAQVLRKMADMLDKGSRR